MVRHFTIDETAQILNITRKAVERRIARGQLPFRKFGRRVLIPSGELEKFLAALPGRTAEQAVAAVSVRPGFRKA